MKILKHLIAFVAVYLGVTESSAQTMNIVWDANIRPNSRTVRLSYDFGNTTYTLKVHVRDLGDDQPVWTYYEQLDMQLSGSGTFTLLVDYGIQDHQHTHQIDFRLKEQGSSSAWLENPNWQVAGFQPLDPATLTITDVQDNQHYYRFTVEAKYGQQIQEDSVKLVMDIDNISDGNSDQQTVFINAGQTFTWNPELYFWGPGVYQVCFEIWYKDANVFPLWNWTLIKTNCGYPDPMVIEYDLSTATEEVEAPKCGSPKAWPNPTSGPITLEGFAPEREINLVDAAGKTITSYSGMTQQLDLSMFSNGVYVLSQGDKGCFSVVKQN